MTLIFFFFHLHCQNSKCFFENVHIHILFNNLVKQQIAFENLYE